MIILDSDIIIDFLRNYPPAIEWLASMGDEEITLPGYVVMQTALSLYLPLHTFNRKHYEIIPDLVTIQPYRK